MSTRKYYDCIVLDSCEDEEIVLCELRFKSIYQVCKFLETCCFDLIEVQVITPSNKIFLGSALFRFWSNEVSL